MVAGVRESMGTLEFEEVTTDMSINQNNIKLNMTGDKFHPT